MKPKISLIAAIGPNRELGRDNKLLWNIPEDMKYFRETTAGHTVIMGRKTFESIGRLLPNRTNIVITRDQDYKIEGAFVAYSLEEAIEVGKREEILHGVYPESNRRTQNDKPEVFIIGGGQIYKQAIGLADRLYLTVVEGKFDADTFFPDYSEFKKTVYRKESSDKNFHYTFLQLER